jgi:hypothetical protein
MLLSTHIRFTYTNASQYLINIRSIYLEVSGRAAQGYGKNTTAFSTLGPAATAEFSWK